MISKLPDVGTTIFTVMSKMAADHQAINLSQGYPDFDAPRALIENLHQYAEQGFNQYPPMHGIAPLREAISQKSAACYGAEVDPETEITITSGATEALFVAIQAVTRFGDEVIVLDPAYDAYDPAIRLAGGLPVHVDLHPEDFSIDWQRLNDVVNDKTTAIVINTPHNPTGSTLAAEDLQQLAKLVSAKGLYVISDEVYEHMVFDEDRHHSALSLPELASQSFVISSFGKTYHATGWKVGYCIAPPALSIEFRKIHQFVTFTTHTPTQWAIADFLREHPEHHQGLSDFYQAKRDLFLKTTQDIGFTMRPSAGTYFQLAEYDALSTKPDTDFVIELTQEAGVAAIPVSVFYQQPPSKQLVRFCFAKQDETLIEAADKLRRYFS